MLEISTAARVDAAAKSTGEPDFSSDVTDHEVANMDFSDYIFFLEEIERR